MTDLHYTKEREEWEKWFASLNNEELIKTFNGGVGIKAWGNGRAAYVSCLEKEIIKRDFDSSILFGEDKYGQGKSFHLGYQVQLIKGKLNKEDDLENSILFV